MLMTLSYFHEILLRGLDVIKHFKCLCLIRKSTNVLEAASQGASCAVGLVADIVVNLISFLALLAFLDTVISWLGGMLDCPQLSFAVKTLTTHKHQLSNTYMYILYTQTLTHMCSLCLFLSLLIAHLLLHLYASLLHDGCFLGGQFHCCWADRHKNIPQWVCGLSEAVRVNQEAESRRTSICKQHKAVYFCKSHSLYSHACGFLHFECNGRWSESQLATRCFSTDNSWKNGPASQLLLSNYCWPFSR